MALSVLIISWREVRTGLALGGDWGEAGERRDLVMECHQAVGQLSCSSRPPAVVLVMATDGDKLQPCSVARRR